MPEQTEVELIERLTRVETKLDVVLVGHDKAIADLRQDHKEQQLELDKLKRAKNVLIGAVVGACIVGGAGTGLSLATLIGG